MLIIGAFKFKFFVMFVKYLFINSATLFSSAATILFSTRVILEGGRTFCLLLVARYFLLVAFYSLLVTFSLLLFARCSLLTARLLVAYCEIKLLWTAKKWFGYYETPPQIFSLQISEIFVTFSGWLFSKFSEHAIPFSKLT